MTRPTGGIARPACALGGFAVAIEESGDRLLVARQRTRQGVDLRLSLGGQGGKLGAIAREERGRVRRLAATMVASSGEQPGDQRGHAARDLPVDEVQLPLCLPARLFQAGEVSAEFGSEGHGDPLPCQPTKLDGPA